jgi:hypothetical protein
VAVIRPHLFGNLVLTGFFLAVAVLAHIRLIKESVRLLLRLQMRRLDSCVHVAVTDASLIFIHCNTGSGGCSSGSDTSRDCNCRSLLHCLSKSILRVACSECDIGLGWHTVDIDVQQ